MAAPAIQNNFQLKKVAETSSKPCWICFKPTTCVLITECQKDFFYICNTHLDDRGFATLLVSDAEAAEKRRQEAMDRELELLKKEFEEKQKRKEERKKAKMKEKAEDKNKGKEKEKKESAEEDEESKKIIAKEKEISDKAKASSTSGPKVYQLHRDFYNMRLQRIRDKAIAKRNMERLKDPSVFPSVPKGGLV